ncbi:hypothetical protein HDV05_001775, partial [Chytridiales sp. JEL 0842]
MKRKLSTRVSNGVKTKPISKPAKDTLPKPADAADGSGSFDIDAFISSQNDLDLTMLGDSALKPVSKKAQRRAEKLEKKKLGAAIKKKGSSRDGADDHDDEDGDDQDVDDGADAPSSSKRPKKKGKTLSGDVLVVPVNEDDGDEDAEELDQEEEAEMKAYLEILEEEKKAAKAKAKAEREAKKAKKAAGELLEDDEDDDEEDEDDEEEDAEPAEKVYVNDKAGLLSKLSEIALETPTTHLPWVETQSLTTSKPLDLPPESVDDDLKRETAFYKQALESVHVGFKKLKEAG